MNLRKTFLSFRFAFEGILDVSKHNNMRVHYLAAVVAISLSIFLKINTTEWCFIIGCICLVLAAEIMNSAIEYTVDLVTKEQHELARKAKDAGSASVLVLSILSVIIACIIFIPKILILLK